MKNRFRPLGEKVGEPVNWIDVFLYISPLLLRLGVYKIVSGGRRTCMSCSWGIEAKSIPAGKESTWDGQRNIYTQDLNTKAGIFTIDWKERIHH